MSVDRILLLAEKLFFAKELVFIETDMYMSHYECQELKTTMNAKTMVANQMGMIIRSRACMVKTTLHLTTTFIAEAKQ